MRKLMSGNEAIAYGAYLSGVKVGSAYPGTPSTEVMDNFSRYPGVYAEWAPNEKVALDVGIGAAYAGSRAMVAMKHVGLNVAADALFYSSYTGLNGGLIIINADDPGMHSSQNEQDNRVYAKFAKVPMLEPADSEDAKTFVKVALELSETFDTPVILRTTTRISHSKSSVELEDSAAPASEKSTSPAYNRDPGKFVMVPANARRRHPVVEDRLAKLAAYAETAEINRIEMGKEQLGIIAGGIAYQYAREVFPDASFLKLGMVYPLPQELIRSFAAKVKVLLVVEELEPFIEEHIRLMGIPVKGKGVFPITGEFSPHLVRECAAKAGLINMEQDNSSTTVSQPELPVRPPMLCPGCGHRGVFHTLSKLDVLVLGDIGCYTLGAAPPLSAMHTCGCMGASIGVAHGVDKAGVSDRSVAIIGDSTFFHTGITPLINVLYNQGTTTTIVLDNRVTAMTGHQVNPGTGLTLQNKETREINISGLAKSIGYEMVDEVSPYDLDKLSSVIEKHINSSLPSLISVKHPCVLNVKEKHPAPVVDQDICVNCGTCLELGCSPLTQEEDHVSINPLLCNGCGLCVQVCPAEAILVNDDNNGKERR
ncbi:indolepyruvate ferredoxin oxidoreductase subunit alpha [Desulfoscipio gibsoniae]|uniref:Indolepyruvate oxidoreductase subunit IorA n=1 Tax=Desulfoscipio gibsoniae DSM 7213 TaxID=767817 RepID=R4KGY2_9FIRM|nr:indolepyruvate ferredoxin oxidoreductase subunit alpha [Desulfoscipio gibsoniae]AGL00912.1 indolepyruvate ferredoxin oxidoreductase, alpha subunit [Desulfoscipio gibsoniae DSM 7213]